MRRCYWGQYSALAPLLVGACAWLLAGLPSRAAGVEEDFSNGTADNWVVVNGSWAVTDQQYAVQSGTRKCSSAYYNATFTNFVFEARMLKKSGASTDNLGLFFHGDPSQIDTDGNWRNGYKVYFGSGDWALARWVNGTRQSFQGWTHSANLNDGFNAWNTLKVSCAEGTIQVFINGVLEGTLRDTTFRSGKVGLTMFDSGWAGVGRFDDVVLREEQPVFGWSAAEVTASEHNPVVTLTVQRTGSASGSATIEYFTTNGNAMAPNDYVAVAGTLSFAPGQTSKAVTIALVNDAGWEAVETFGVGLRAPSTGHALGSPALATVTLHDDDPRPLEQGPVLLHSDRDGDFEIFVMNPDGSGMQQLTFNSAHDAQARWSPDGQLIYFIRNEESVWVMDREGRNERRLTSGVTVAVSPDGRKLALSQMVNFYVAQDLFLYDLATGNTIKLADSTGDDYQPDFSPDGTRVVFVHYFFYNAWFKNLCTVNTDGTHRRQLTAYDEYSAAFPADPRWSPDGTRILFRNNGPDQLSLLQTLNPDGTGQAGYIQSGAGSLVSPVWAPDGRSVLSSLNGAILKTDFPFTASQVLLREPSSALATDWLRATPTPPSNVVRLVNFKAQPGGAFRFELQAPAGTNYIVQASTNLATWTAIATNTLPTNGVWTITDSASTNLPRRFYRAVQQ